jgi:hypothetical protein
MKWVTRHHVKVDRAACPWLIRRFIDSNAEFMFVPSDQVREIAHVQGAIPFDVEGAELGHHGQECSFEAILKKSKADAGECANGPNSSPGDTLPEIPRIRIHSRLRAGMQNFQWNNPANERRLNV